MQTKVRDDYPTSSMHTRYRGALGLSLKTADSRVRRGFSHCQYHSSDCLEDVIVSGLLLFRLYADKKSLAGTLNAIQCVDPRNFR